MHAGLEPPGGTPIPPHRPLTEFYRAPDERRQFLNELFDGAAGDYNWMSGALSFWTDRKYRVTALRNAGLRQGMKMLDVATGTGLVVQAALDIGLGVQDIVGLDPSAGMLAENRRTTGVQLIQGRGEALPFADGTFDFLSLGYALRHVEDLMELFGEFRRVLRPGGRVLILEISRPSSRPAFAAMGFYMRRVLPLLMRWRRRPAEASRLLEYYWATISECVPPGVILDALTRTGLQCDRRRFPGGVLNEYLGIKDVRQPVS